MSDPEILDYLREQFARLHQLLDRMDQKLVVDRCDNSATVETPIGHLTANEQIHYGVTMRRIDGLERRLDRIERRLDLVPAP